MARQKFKFSTNTNSKSENVEKNNAVEKKATGEEVSRIVQKLKEEKHSSIGEYKVVARHKLRCNKKNKYPMTSLESLKESILRYGLQQDITAVYVTDEDMYVLETGHRRKTSIDMLIEEFENYPDDSTDERYLLYKKNVKKYEYGYYCKITGRIAEDVVYDLEDEDNLSSASDEVLESEIRLEITNIESRNDNASRAENILRLTKLYEEQNKRNPKSNRININEKISEDTGLKKRQVASYKSLSKLIPELMEEFNKNNITLEQGSNYAKLNEEEQNTIVELLQSGKNFKNEEIKILLQEKAALKEELHNKSKELEEAKLFSKDTTDKDTQIESLEKEIASLKEKTKNVITDDNNVKEIINTELQFKTLYNQCEKSISKMQELLTRYKMLYNENAPKSVSTVDECYELMKNLKSLFV